MNDEILKSILNELQAVRSETKEINRRLDQMDTRFEQIDQRFGLLEQKVDLLQVYTKQSNGQGVELINSVATLNGNVEELREIVCEI